MSTSFVRNRRSSPLVVVLALFVSLAACSDPGQRVGACLANQQPAIRLSVTDAVTSQPLADFARGVAQSGNYVDSLRAVGSPPEQMIGGWQSGIYDVRIERTGYAEWTRALVFVAHGVCAQPMTVSLEARMQPAP